MARIVPNCSAFRKRNRRSRDRGSPHQGRRDSGDTDLRDKEGKDLAERINDEGDAASYWHLDVAREKEVRHIFEKIHERFGRIDILVNNAGIAGATKPTYEITEEEWDHVQAVNVKGVFFCTKHAIPFLRRAGGGSIINLFVNLRFDRRAGCSAEPIYGYDGLPPDQVITNVQGALQRLGYYRYAVHGVLGPLTRAAIANYQRDYGLAATGAIDPQTLTSLSFIA